MSITAVPPGKKHRKKNKKAQKALKPQWSTYKRIAWLLPVFALFFLALLIRIFWLQVIDAKELQQKALSQWTRPTTVTAERGMIIDCNGQTLAKDGPVYKIVIWPNSISESDRVRVATELSRVLDLNYEKVLERVSSKKLREFILKRQVSKEACDEIRSLQLGGGVGISPDTKRYYPFGTLLSQTIGFTSTDGTGQSGLELTYNKYLTGKDGERIAETDSRGNQIADSMIQEFPPTDGSTLKLTVDANIQSYLENALAEAVQVNNAKNAQGIIMDVNTGAIVAISTKPDYDPNSPPRDDMQMLAELSRNRIVTDAYEPGSTFKILTLAAALDSGSTHLEDSFYCNGGYIVNGERIKCWKHAGHVRILPGDAFVVYAPGPDGKSMKAVALQIEDMMTAGIYGAANGEPRKIYIAADKSNFNEALSNNQEESIFTTLGKICRSVNLQLVPIRMSGLEEIPEDAAGFMIIGSKYDLSPQEAEVLQRYWARPNAAILIMLEPRNDTPRQLYRFLREQGLRPQNDRVMLRNRGNRSVFEINSIFAPSLNCTREFWNSSTGLEGESISLILDSDNAAMEQKRITPYPLLVTTEDYYGETKYNQFPAKFDAREDNPGPLMIGAALIRGNAGDVNQNKTTGRLVLLGNTDLLQPRQIKPEQRDFMRTLIGWMTDREELRGLGSRHDLTVKLNLDRNALGVLELLTNIGLPLLALLIALIIWNTRRH